MTKEELRNLGERAVKCRAWRWMPGTLTLRDPVSGSPVRVLSDGGKEVSWQTSCGEWDLGTMRPIYGDRPDLSDPATLGCIEHGLLPAAWGEARVPILTRTLYGKWVVMVWSLPAPNGQRVREGAAEESTSKAGALVAALEAAPCGQ